VAPKNVGFCEERVSMSNHAQQNPGGKSQKRKKKESCLSCSASARHVQTVASTSTLYSLHPRLDPQSKPGERPCVSIYTPALFSHPLHPQSWARKEKGKKRKNEMADGQTRRAARCTTLKTRHEHDTTR
jgi:hypothetical protein